MPDASPLQVLGDHLRSTSTIANADGTRNSVIQYTAFGRDALPERSAGREIRLTQGVTPTKYRYTGQLAQAELGLDYYVARWYDPVLGHFTQADTIIPEPGKSQSFDRYAYVMNNPLRYVDPSGKRMAGSCEKNEDCENKKDIPPKPPEKSIYIFNKTEDELAKIQGNQGTSNNCAMYAIAASFNLFFDSNVSGGDIANVIDSNWSPFYRIYPNWATTPLQQIHIINSISTEGNLGINATKGSNDKTELIRNLKNNRIIQIVTFVWIIKEPPNIQHGNKSSSILGNSKTTGGHVMILAAYDINHKNDNGELTPWGFINSWGNYINEDYELDWMSDENMSPYAVVLMTNRKSDVSYLK